MTHYLSCGHELLEDEDGNELYLILSTKSYSVGEDGWVNTVLHGSYCLDCAKELEQESLVLHNEQEEIEWLNKGS